jgi:hypothetical protein
VPLFCHITTLAVLLGFAPMIGPSLCSAQTPPVPTPQITVEREGSLLTVRPTYTLPDTAGADTTALRYELTVERTGASTSSSRQGGAFTPTPGRPDTLSTVRLNAVSGDRLTVHLVVRRGEQVIAERTRTEQIGDPE